VGISPRHDFGCVFYIWVLDRALTLDSSYYGWLLGSGISYLGLENLIIELSSNDLALVGWT
jgi:hypothetical protein